MIVIYHDPTAVVVHRALHNKQVVKWWTIAMCLSDKAPQILLMTRFVCGCSERAMVHYQ